jgi:hypothetical protein
MSEEISTSAKRVNDGRFSLTRSELLSEIGHLEHALHVTRIDREAARAELAETHKYAGRLATILYEKHFKDVAPRFELLPDTVGIITQIDNMTCGIDEKAEARGFERGVREAAKACDWGDIYGDNALKCILALLEPNLSDLPHNRELSETAHRPKKEGDA